MGMGGVCGREEIGGRRDPAKHRRSLLHHRISDEVKAILGGEGD